MIPGHGAPWGSWLPAGVLPAFFLVQGLLSSRIKRATFDQTTHIVAGWGETSVAPSRDF
jgi:hypothetical protein